MSADKFLGRAWPWVLALLLSACRTPPSVRDEVAVVPPPSELVQPAYLFEIARHLYRWQLDEVAVARVASVPRFVFWVQRLHPRLDADDHSEWAEIILPQLGLAVKVKKTDYVIEETGLEVKSQGFRITRVSQVELPARAPRACAVVEVEMKALRDYLLRTRGQRENPDPVLVERLRLALRQEAAKEGVRLRLASAGETIIHLAPLSPVANEAWAFWEAGRTLFYFASDIDLANPAVWEHQSLAVRIYDLDEQVVASLEEAPGSGRFLTRFQASRVMFNCLLLGERLTVPPATIAEAPAGR